MIYQAYCSSNKLREFMECRGWCLDDLANWLGVPKADVVEWIHGAVEVPGPVARLVQIEECVGIHFQRSMKDSEDLIWGSYCDAKNAFRLEYHWPDDVE